MERKWMVIIAVIALAFFVYFGYAKYTAPKTKATPEPTVLEETPEVVSASGEVVPVKWANLAFKMSGRVEEVAVEVGDEVEDGQLLARLDTTDLEHAVAQAEAALKVAEARLAQLNAGAREEEIKAAEEAVAAAEADLASAKAELASAQANLAKLLAGPTERELEIAERKVNLAKNQLWGAQGQRDAIKGSPLAEPGEKDAAEAAVGAAYEEVQIAQLEYEDLKAGAREEDIAIARAQVEGARARVNAAKAQVGRAKAQLDLLREGASEEEIAVAQAQVEEAQAALDRARSALEDACLTAPFAGTVTRVDLREGEMVTAGLPVIVIGDLSHLRVETTDLSEIDVAKVKVGQKVDITFDALPETKLAGRVTKIYPMATQKEGGTNYTVVIEFEETDPRLRWGMTAFVDIFVE